MILVTGITGHTGQHFYNLLLENNYRGKIRVIVRENSNVDFLRNSKLDIEVCVANLNNTQNIGRFFEGVETVVHIYNIHHSVDIITHALTKKVKRVILVHTAGVYSEYKAASKSYIEKENEISKKIIGHRLETIVLRPTMIYGDIKDKNISKFIKLIDKFKFIPVVGDGQNLVQPINARDLASVLFTLLSKKISSNYKIYDLSGAEPITIKQLYQLIASKLNKKIYIVPIPIKIALILAKILRIVSLNKIDIVEKVQRMTENRSLQHELAKRELNFTPISIDSGLDIEIEQFLSFKKKE